MADDDTEESKFDSKLKLQSSRINKQLLTGAILLPILLVALVVGILSLGNIHKTTQALKLQEPENRVDEFSNRIDAVKEKVKAQYGKHTEKMNAKGIFDVSEKFGVMYDLSIQSESDYLVLLESYQTLIYESASRVRGSGDWFEFYEPQVRALLKAAQAREEKMKRYFNDQ